MIPIFIVSKGRAGLRGTGKTLEKIGIHNFRFVVEKEDYAKYSGIWGKDRVLILPSSFQHDYETCDSHGISLPLGPGPSRNFAWETARQERSEWHWVMDDNIFSFWYYYGSLNQKGHVRNGTRFFRRLESVITRYANCGMGGPLHEGFVPKRNKNRRFQVNSRIYSCNLIRNSLPFRWRGRFNEDTILSLDILTHRWATILTREYLMKKAETQTMKGGNTDHLYKYGTGPKSRMLARVYPQYVKLGFRYGRIHHFIDYRKHFDFPLIPEKCIPSLS